MGPPGSGKGTLGERLLATDWGRTKLKRVVSHTDRPRRESDHEGQYEFITQKEMDVVFAESDWATHGEMNGIRYVYRRSSILSIVEAGKVPLLDIRTQTLAQLVTKVPELDFAAMLVHPGNVQDLLNRIIGRDGDSQSTRERAALAEDEYAFARTLLRQRPGLYTTIYNRDGEQEAAFGAMLTFLSKHVPELIAVPA